jgi:hypothetical protein
MTPTEVLGEVQTHDIFKKSQRRARGLTNDDGKKSIALKAKSTKEDKNDEEEGNDDFDEEMALFIKRFRRMMKKKNYDNKGQSSKNNPFEDKKCFECGEMGHIVINSPNKKNKYKKVDDKKKKKKFFKKKMAKLIMLSGTLMQAPTPMMMMMMTSLPRELRASLSRKLHHYSLLLFVSWQKVNQRYHMMVNLIMHFLMMIF